MALRDLIEESSTPPSDGEDPYDPRTEHQKRQQKQDLETRGLAFTLRKMRKIHGTRQQRLKKQKQRPSPFEKLPTELVLTLMRHTHLRDLPDLIRSSATNQCIFKANEKAVIRGIEIEQFPDWRWLFGDSKYRTSAQMQHLKDAILSENQIQNPGSHGWVYDEDLLGILKMIDKNEFTGVRNVMFLQDMQDRVDADIKVTESYIGAKMARRTAMCLRSLSFQRPSIVKEGILTVVNLHLLPWKARSQLINEQPASIQAEIRGILKIFVQDLFLEFPEVAVQWMGEHYGTTGQYHKLQQEARKWMSKLVTGLILEMVIPQWRTETPESSPASCFAWESSSFHLALPRHLKELLVAHDGGNVDVMQEVKNGVKFGKRIGLDLEGLLDGILAAAYLDFFRLDQGRSS